MRLPGLLEESAPRVGLFWNGGNPAALPFEVTEKRSLFGASRGGASGEYRRPFDPGSESRSRAEASGRQPLGSRGAGVASALLEDASFQEGVFSNVLRSYTSSPHVVADTSGTDLDQLGARAAATGLEGTLGGRWRASPGRTFWACLSTASLDPGNSVTTLPLLPQGQRKSWNLSFGIVLGP